MTSPIRWTVYTLLAAFGVAVIAFPEAEPVTRDGAPTITNALRDANLDWMLQSERLRRAHSRVVAREAVATARTTDASARYEFVSPPVFAGEEAEAVRLAADRTLASERDSSVRIIVAMVLDSGEMLDGVPANRGRWWTSTDTFFPGTITPNSCVMVVRARPKHRRDPALPTFGGSACYWFGRYGLPGAGLAAVLDSTGHRPVLFRERSPESARDSYLGYAADRDVRVQKCRAGDRSMCEKAFLGTPQRRDGFYAGLVTRGWTGVGRNVGSNTDYLAGVFLSRLERELGARDFSKVWKSDEDFRTAFAAARGQPLGEWIHDIIIRELDHRRRGPVPLPGLLLSAGLVISGLVAAGLAGASKRSGIV